MSAKTVLICLVACAGSFSAGYFLKESHTQSINSKEEMGSSIAINSQTNPVRDTILPTTKVPAVKAQTALIAAQDPFDAIDDFLNRYKDTNYLTIPNKALAPLYLQLSQLDDYQLQQKAEELISQLPNPAASRLLGITLEVLAESQPLQALDMALNINDSEQFKWTYAWSVLSTWSANSPLEAFEWYVVQDFNQPNLKGFGTHNMVSTAVLSGLYSFDKSLAVSKIAELSQQNKISPSTMSLISQNINHSDEFRSLLNALGSSQNNNSGAIEVAGEWFSKQPQDAAAWVSMLNEEQKSPRLFRHALNRWVETQPLQASDWYIKQFNEQDKASAISEAASRYANKDPKAALNWVDSLGRSDTQNAVEDLLQSASYDDPDFTLANLDRITDEKRKISVLQSAIYSIKQHDPQRANSIIESSPYKSQLEEYIKRINEY